MTRYFIKRIFFAAMFLFLSGSTMAGARDEQMANVTVDTHTLNGQLAYTYTITNICGYPDTRAPAA